MKNIDNFYQLVILGFLHEIIIEFSMNSHIEQGGMILREKGPFMSH